MSEDVMVGILTRRYHILNQLVWCFGLIYISLNHHQPQSWFRHRIWVNLDFDLFTPFIPLFSSCHSPWHVQHIILSYISKISIQFNEFLSHAGLWLACFLALVLVPCKNGCFVRIAANTCATLPCLPSQHFCLTKWPECAHKGSLKIFYERH